MNFDTLSLCMCEKRKRVRLWGTCKSENKSDKRIVKASWGYWRWWRGYQDQNFNVLFSFFCVGIWARTGFEHASGLMVSRQRALIGSTHVLKYHIRVLGCHVIMLLVLKTTSTSTKSSTSTIITWIIKIHEHNSTQLHFSVRRRWSEV